MPNTDYMTVALTIAQKALALDETPVGAVIVKDGIIIAAAHNLTQSHNDATAHAEMLVLRDASRKLGTRFLTGCSLYVTLEPCAMCAGAISLTRIERLYFGAYDPKGGAVEHGPRFFQQSTCHHAPEITGGLQAEACGALLQQFFKAKR